MPQGLALRGQMEMVDKKQREPHDYVELEESWTGEGNHYENDEPPQQQSARMTAGMRERILHYATYVQRRGLSKEEIKDLELLVTIISGTSSSLLSYERDVKPFLDSTLEEYNTRRYYFCSTCEEAMDGPHSLCRNVDCNLYKYIRWCLITHDDEDRGDIRLYEGYYENIENSNEFARKELKILLSLSTDGFRPRRLSKREVWPLYIRVEGLPQAEANDFYNSILSGVIYNRLKPSDRMVETLFLRLESELHDLHESPFQLQVGEELWNIKIALYRGIADMPVCT
ncbi:unnamed protein product [Cylicostephanus goldi]|uniref:Uncharacterized protein n=1 Tax=Cylicostephanus goldi TaxID=71465 RepID=A0A3P6SRX7_CYLGO|nr:unnamed protein product [Cylicostephanus goldi]